MANAVAPMGFQVARATVGGASVGMANTYWIPATDTNAYRIGDPVISAAGSDIVNGLPGVTLATGASGEFVRGVIVGVYPTTNIGGTPNLQGTTLSLEIIYVPATKTRGYYVSVMDDPTCVFEVADDGGGSATVATIAAYASKNCLYTPTVPANTLIPISATVLNFTTAPTTTAALPIKILGLLQSQAPGGGNQLAPFAKWLVKFNNHELAQQSAGV